MEIKTDVILDMLTNESVSVLIRQYTEIKGEYKQVGENARRAFTNTLEGRSELQEYLADYPEHLSAVMTIWGEMEG